MIKHFCDGCEKEITRNYVTQRLKKTLQLNGKKFLAIVMIPTDSVSLAGDLCLECVLKIVNEGSDD